MEYVKLAGHLAWRVTERVELPRTVIIKNIRLGFALRSAQLLSAILVAWLVFYRSQWIKSVEPHNSLLTGWDDTESYREQNALDRSSGFCQNLSTFDYVYSSSRWRYTDYSCVTPVQMLERSWKEGSRLVFVPTAFEESSYQVVRAESGDCSGITEECGSPDGWLYEVDAEACTCTTAANFFITGVDALTLAFDHGYSVEVPDGMFLANHGQPFSSQRSDISCEEENLCDQTDVPEGKTKELKTVVVVLDKDRKEHLMNVFDAPTQIRVRLKDLFAKSGASLESETKTVSNLLRCSSPNAEEPCSPDARRFPTARQSGMGITIHLQYFNRLSAPQDLPCDGCLDNHVGPVCKAVFTLEPSWHSRPKFDCDNRARATAGESACVSRYYYGLKISFISSGSYGVFDIVSFMVTVGAGLVYLGIPLIVIHVIAMYLVGALSNVYRKADKEEVAVDTQLAGFVIRMIMAQSAYTMVTGGEDEVLTKEMLLARIHACVKTADKKHDLDEQEQIQLAELVMQVLDSEQDKTIQMHDFVHAVTCNDPVNLKDAIKLFDDDRKLGCLERLFRTKTFASNCNNNKYFEKENGKYVVNGDLDELTVTHRLSGHCAQNVKDVSVVSVHPYSHVQAPALRATRKGEVLEVV